VLFGVTGATLCPKGLPTADHTPPQTMTQQPERQLTNTRHQSGDSSSLFTPNTGATKTNVLSPASKKKKVATAQNPEQQLQNETQRSGESSSPLAPNTADEKTNMLSTAPKRNKAGTPSPAALTKKNQSATKSNSKAKASPDQRAKSSAQVTCAGHPEEKPDGGWPKGWIKKICEFKLRSMIQFKKFIAALMDSSRDEKAAFQTTRNN
jgi:hypothetical protein